MIGNSTLVIVLGGYLFVITVLAVAMVLMFRKTISMSKPDEEAAHAYRLLGTALETLKAAVMAAIGSLATIVSLVISQNGG